MGDVGACNGSAPPDVLAVRRPVGAGQGLVGQPWRSYDGPVQAAVPYDVLHQPEISIVLAERGFCQRTEQVPHEEPVTGVMFRWLRTAGRRHGGDGRGADNDDTSHVRCLHRIDDGPRAL